MRPQILIVDDDHSVLKALHRLLKFRYDVVHSDNAMGAMRIAAQADQLDAVVTDFRMPDVNGVELLKGIRTVCPGAKRVLLTASPPPNAEAVADRVIDKSSGAEELLSFLEREFGDSIQHKQRNEAPQDRIQKLHHRASGVCDWIRDRAFFQSAG